MSEVFGPTVQGEGPSLGQRAGFVRLGRCHLACQWCDTPYTWDWDRFDRRVELTRRTTEDVVAEVAAMHVDLAVITGGEPLLQQPALEVLVDALRQRGMRVEVETSGTVAPRFDVDQWNVSPKLAHSGMDIERRYLPAVLRGFQDGGHAVFKFVVTSAGDLDEIAGIVDECGLANVWVMPEGTTAETLNQRLAWLAPSAIDRGWNVTTRMHILVWGDRRGV